MKGPNLGICSKEKPNESSQNHVHDFLKKQLMLQGDFLLTNVSGKIKIKFEESQVKSLNFANAYYSDFIHVDTRAGEDSFLLVNVPIGEVDWTVQGKEFQTSKSDLVMMNPNDELLCHTINKTEFTNVSLSKTELNNRLSKLIGRRITNEIKFNPSACDPLNYNFLRVLMRQLQKESFTDSLSLKNDLCSSQLEELFYTLLFTSIPHNYSAELKHKPSNISPWYVKRAQDYILSNLCEPLTIALLAEQVDISMRSLSHGFVKYTGQTVSRYIRDQRLQSVRIELLHNSHRTVASAAYKYGFTHMGRFSSYYKQLFGESPSETRRK